VDSNRPAVAATRCPDSPTRLHGQMVVRDDRDAALVRLFSAAWPGPPCVVPPHRRRLRAVIIDGEMWFVGKDDCGEQNQAVGRSRGGRNTKIHAITDAKGRLLNFVLTGGEAHDCPIGAELIEESKPAELMLADKGYDSAELRQQLNDRGTKAVIPNRSNRKKKFRFDRKRYRDRHRIENAFCRIKDFRRIATRYDKLAVVFAASVHLAATIAWWV
jgi:transposase